MQHREVNPACTSAYTEQVGLKYNLLVCISFQKSEWNVIIIFDYFFWFSLSPHNHRAPYLVVPSEMTTWARVDTAASQSEVHHIAPPFSFFLFFLRCVCWSKKQKTHVSHHREWIQPITRSPKRERTLTCNKQKRLRPTDRCPVLAAIKVRLNTHFCCSIF